MDVVNASTAMHALRAVANSMPEGYAYLTDGFYSYVRPNAGNGWEGDCILGHVLIRIGAKAEALVDIGSFKNERGTLRRAGVEFTDRAFFCLDAAQALQDLGVAWSKVAALVVALADRHTWDADEKFVGLGSSAPLASF